MTARVRMLLAATAASLLATQPLSVVFQDHGWLGPALLVVLVVAVGGELARRARLPALLQPLVPAALVTGFVTAWFAHGHAWLAVVPSGRTFDELGRLWDQAFSDIGELAAPVPTSKGIVLVTVLGVAVVAACIDLIAVSLRRPAVAGLALLLLFAVPAAVSPHGVGVWGFLTSATGWLLLLAAERQDRVLRWGRSLGEGMSERQVRALGASVPGIATGRRIGLAALGAALVVPLLVPGLVHRPLGQRGSSLFSGPGSSTVTTFNPIVRLRDELNDPEDRPLITVRTDDQAPGYLRMTSLDRFDGATWSASPMSGDTDTRVSHGLPSITLSIPTAPVHHQVRVGGSLSVHWLPLPYYPTDVKVKGDWRYDLRSGTVFSARNTSRDAEYDVTSLDVLATPDDLRAATEAPAPQSDYLLLPPDLPREVSDLTTQVTQGATTPYDRAVAIQEYLRSPPFAYDTQVPRGNGNDALLAFLRAKRGFCEQYAATMAVMARVAGIPARVAIGFTPGTRQSDGSWLISTHDAHAWPELFFEGAGWLRFEPTPRGDGQATTPAYAVPSGQGNGSTPDGGTPSGQTNGGQGGGPTTRPNPRIDDPKPIGPLPPLATGGGRHLPIAGLSLAGLVVLLLAAPLLLRHVVRRRRWARARTGDDLAHAAWREVRDDARDVGLAWVASDSPRHAAARLAQAAALPAAAHEALTRVVRTEERARYAPAPPTVEPGELRRDVATVRAALRASVGRGRRLRAVLVPPSSRQWLTRGTGAVADALDALDRRLSALRVWASTRLLRRRPAPG